MAALDQLSDITRLRAEISRMQRRTAEFDALPVHDVLAPLFPSGGLRPGASYALPDSPALLFALLGAASRDGSWCAFVGMPDLSFEAAEGYGIAPERLAVIPRPGEKWHQAVSSAAEVFPLVAARPPRATTAAEASRLAARLRDRGSTLLIAGAWPGAELSFTMGEAEWHGIGRGHGLISSRAVTIVAAGRRLPVANRVRMLLPGPTGGVERPEHTHPATARAERGHLVAVSA